MDQDQHLHEQSMYSRTMKKKVFGAFAFESG